MSDTKALARGVAVKAMRIYIKQTKTVDYMRRTLWRAVRELYANEIDEFEMIDIMTSVITEQYNRAWREGARSVNVDPRDFEEEDFDEIERLIDAEFEFIPDFVQDIVDARTEEKPVEPFRSRVDMWASRYNQIVDLAKVWFGDREKLEWIYGDTEHCATCLALNGIVAWAKEWAEADVMPQSDKLECGGFRCKCRLEPTTRRRTARALDRIYAALGA